MILVAHQIVSLATHYGGSIYKSDLLISHGLLSTYFSSIQKNLLQVSTYCYYAQVANYPRKK